jgi:hypothetical protein
MAKMNLNDILGKLRDLDAGDRKDIIKDALAGDKVNLADLRGELIGRANDLVSVDKLSEEQVADSELIATLLDSVKSKIDTIAQRDAKIEAAREALRFAVDQTSDVADTVAVKKAESTPKPETGDSGGNGGEPAADAAAPTPDATADAGKELIVASGNSAPKSGLVPLATFNTQGLVTQGMPVNDSGIIQTITASGDLPGYAAGTELDSIDKLVAAVQTGFAALSRAGGGQSGLAIINREAPDHLVYASETDWRKLDELCAAERVTDESLVAAAGFCAPSEVLYDTCPVVSTLEGMLSLPTMLTRRGGIKYSQRPDFGQIYAGAGFILTEAQIIAGQEKPCQEIMCPDDLTECREDVSGICLTANILMEKGWPEKVAEYIRNVLIAHAHKLNCEVIKRVVAQAGDVVTIGGSEPDPNAAVYDPMGPGMAETILGAVELQVQYLRYKWRLSQRAVIDGFAPYWLMSVLRSDLSKKVGVSDRWSWTDAQILQWFRERGVRLQLVYDWQDAMCSGNPADFGGTAPTRWPANVQIMLFEPGAFFRLASPIINLDGVYDQASLKKNQYTRIFTEEAFQVCHRCGNSVLLNIPICPNGLSGATQSTTCTAPTP